MFLPKQLGVLGFVLGAALAVSCGSGDEPEIDFILPSEGMVTRGELGIALRVQGIAPERVSLFVDEAWLANLEEASYRWDTRSWPEGEHTLIARAFAADEVYSSKGLKVVVDRTPPQIVSMQPAPGTSDVAVDAPISLVFSEPLAASVLATASLLVSVSGEGTETLEPSSLSPDGRTLFFPRPSRPYLPPVTISALLVGSVEDAVGNVLVPARDSGWSWQVPVLLSVGDAMADLDTSSRPFGARVALRPDGEGRPVVAWSPSPGYVFTRRWDGTKWVSLPSGLEVSVNGAFTANDIVLDAQGRPSVAWGATLAQGGRSATYVYRLEEAQWKFLGGVGTNPEGEFPIIKHVALRVAPSGLPRVAWLAESKTTPGRAEVMVVQSRGEPGWDFSARSTNALLERSLALEVTASGDPVVAWSERTESSGFRIAVHRVVATGWESLPGTPLSTGSVHNPSLALESDGTPLLAWSRDGAIEVRRWAGGEWQPVGQPIPTPMGKANLVVSALVLRASGQPLLAWSYPGWAEVWGWKEGAWVQLAMLRQPTFEDASPWPVFLRVEGTGSPVMAWMRRDSSYLGRGSLDVYRLNL